MLALAAPKAVGLAELVDGLWGEDPPAAAVNAIQVHASTLRRALGGDLIRRSGAGYRLDGDVSVDAEEFARSASVAARQLRQGRGHDAAARLQEALTLWSGPALADLRGMAFAEVEASRLAELHLNAQEDLFEAELLLGHHQEIIAELEALLARHPLRERLRGELMRALVRSGRQPEALAVYEAGRLVVAEELGLDPSPSLRRLHHDILNEVDRAPVADSSPHGRTALPLTFDELVGREAELVALGDLLAVSRNRLTSLVGPGGVGKTRLAVELAGRLAGRYRDGVFYVGLASAATSEDVAATMCAAVGIRADRDVEASLAAVLSRLQALLVCDNFEHVLDSAPLLQTLLERAPEVQALVTSRQPLGLPGERQIALSPLSTEPVAGGPSLAAQLFRLRAAATDPLFDADRHTQDVEEVVQRCDGLPLAVELAAGRTTALSVGELRDRLARPLSVLTTVAVRRPARQQTMRSNIAWSVDALAPDELAVLCAATVFRGGFSISAVGHVADLDEDAALEVVEALVNRHLVTRATGVGGRWRFDLLQTIREYAAELLDQGATEAARGRHARAYRDWLNADLGGRRGLYTVGDWLALLKEGANLREAIRWAIESRDTELAVELTNRCAADWQALGSPTQFYDWLTSLLTLPGISPEGMFDTQLRLAWAVADVDPRLMERHLADARTYPAFEEDSRRRSLWLRAFATQLLYLGRTEEAGAAIERCERLLAMHRDDVVLQLDILELRADLAGQIDDLPAALRYGQEALTLASRAGAQLRRSKLIYNYCEALLRTDQPAAAVELAQEGVDLAMLAPARGELSDHLSQRGYGRLLDGDVNGAVDDLVTACAGHVQLGKTLFALDTLLRVAAGAAATGRLELAATALAVVDASPEWSAEPGADETRARFLGDLPAKLGASHALSEQRGVMLVRTRGTLPAISAVLDLLAP